jgi:hypothetical protein
MVVSVTNGGMEQESLEVVLMEYYVGDKERINIIWTSW